MNTHLLSTLKYNLYSSDKINISEMYIEIHKIVDTIEFLLVILILVCFPKMFDTIHGEQNKSN